jgi:PAS domain S-box-containing protein
VSSKLKLFNLFFIFILVYFCSFSSCKNQQNIPAKSIDQKKLPYILEIVKEVHNPENVNFIIEDLNNDGLSEIIIFGPKRKNDPTMGYLATISDLFMTKSVEQMNFNGKIQIKCLNNKKENTKDIFVSEQVGDSAFLNIYSHKGVIEDSFFVTSGNPKGEHQWQCFLEPVDRLDINNDGHSDLLLNVFTTYAYQPRGIFAIDENSNAVIQKYLAGTPITISKIIDLNGDGNPEILLNSGAPGNGEKDTINGTDDGHSYFMILDHNLKEIINIEKGEIKSSIYTHSHDMNHDGQPEILIFKNSTNLDFQENSLIIFWNFADQLEYNEQEFEISLRENTVFFDFNGDGIDEFLAIKGNGELEIRNIRNQVEKSRSLGDTPDGRVKLFDLNSDGEQEIIITGSSTIYIFTKDLQLLTKFACSPPLGYQIYSKGIGQPKGLFVTSGAIGYYLEMKRNYSAFFSITSQQIFGFFAGGIVMFFLLLGIHNRHRKKLSSIISQNYLDIADRGLLTIDQNGFVINLNLKAREILGITDVLLHRTPLVNIFIGEQFDKLRSIFQQSLESKISSKKFQITFRTEDNTKELLILLIPIRSKREQYRGLIVNIDDITPLSQSKKAIAWAAMAQQLAHKIKTPMSSIMLAVQRLQMEYNRDKVKKIEIYDRYVDYVNSEIHNLRQAADDFMKLAHMEEPLFKSEDINKLLMENINYLQNKVYNEILITSDLSNDLPLVYIDKNQMRVALNIILDNSFESMGNTGKIVITTRLAQTLQSSELNNFKNYIKIEIADTGIGISKDILSKIFEPFFTTKKEGTGFGLTIAKKIIEDHDGEIKISSEKGIGTILTVILPIKP